MDKFFDVNKADSVSYAAFCVEDTAAKLSEMAEELKKRGQVLTKFIEEYDKEIKRQLEEKQEIHVGDEVIVNGLTGVVMKLDEKGNVDRYFTCDGRTFGNISGFQNNEVKKTGRHFPEVAELLEKMNWRR